MELLAVVGIGFTYLGGIAYFQLFRIVLSGYSTKSQGTYADMPSTSTVVPTVHVWWQ